MGRLETHAAVIDWAHQRLETLLAIGDKPKWTKEMILGVVRDVSRSLDLETNPKLRDPV